MATATALDDEMRERIAHHQARRTAEWNEHEVPLALAEALTRFQRQDLVLVDCLTLWLNNLLFEHEAALCAARIEQHVDSLLAALAQTKLTLFWSAMKWVWESYLWAN